MTVADEPCDIVASTAGAESLVYRNVGNGTFSGTIDLPAARGTRSVEIADLDSDQLADVVLASVGRVLTSRNESFSIRAMPPTATADAGEDLSISVSAHAARRRLPTVASSLIDASSARLADLDHLRDPPRRHVAVIHRK